MRPLDPWDGRPPPSPPRPPWEGQYLDIADVSEADVLALLPAILPFLRAPVSIEGHKSLNNGGLLTSFANSKQAAAAATLVHCLQGQSRSAAAVMAHLLASHTMPTLAQAHAHLARRRPALCVNPGFLLQLAWLEDHMQGRGLLSEYRVSLLADNAPVMASSSSLTAARVLVDRIDATVAAVGAAVGAAATRTGQWRCRQCRQALFSSSDVVRHGHTAVLAAAARMVAVAEGATQEAEAFYNYARVFRARPMLHCQRVGKKEGGKSKGQQQPPLQGRGQEEEEEQGDCPWVYVQPPGWTMPALLPDATAAAVASLRCPGRHCGRALGVAERLGCGGAIPDCECGAALPLYVVRFRRQLVFEEQEEEGMSIAGKGTNQT